LKHEANESTDENLPLDLSCSKSKRSCEDDYWTSQHTQAVYPFPTKSDQFQELNDLATTAMFFNNIKHEQINSGSSKSILDLTNSNFLPIKQESYTANFRQIEQTIREKYQYPQPLPIPDGKSCSTSYLFI
jgi:hypothetical protein